MFIHKSDSIKPISAFSQSPVRQCFHVMLFSCCLLCMKGLEQKVLHIPYWAVKSNVKQEKSQNACTDE